MEKRNVIESARTPLDEVTAAAERLEKDAMAAFDIVTEKMGIVANPPVIRSQPSPLKQ